MEGQRFDALAKALSSTGSRRDALRVGLAAFAGLVSSVGIAVGKGKKTHGPGSGKKKGPHRRSHGPGGGDHRSASAHEKRGGDTPEASSQVGKAAVETKPRKVVVFISGVCSVPDDLLFAPLQNHLTDQIATRRTAKTSKSSSTTRYGYDAFTDFLYFSYPDPHNASRASGHLVCIDGQMNWEQDPYDMTDPAANRIDDSVQRLDDVLRAYRVRNPEAKFVLVGHSLGGVIALREIDKAPEGLLDTVITIDSPLHGIKEYSKPLLDALATVGWAEACFATGAAIDELVKMGGPSPATNAVVDRIARLAYVKGIKLVTMGNVEDFLYNPIAYPACLLCPNTNCDQCLFGVTDTQWTEAGNAKAIKKHFLRTDVSSNRNECLDITNPDFVGNCVKARHTAFLDEIDGLKALLTAIGKQNAKAAATACCCPEGQRECSGTFGDTTDNQNCGQCGNACGAGATCTNGTCACGGGQIYCATSKTCVNTKSDSQNCGRCGNGCAAGASCAAGHCKAQSGNASAYDLVKTWNVRDQQLYLDLFISGLAIDRAEHLWIADSNNALLFVYTTDGSSIGQIDPPGQVAEIALDSDDNLYITEASSHQIVKLLTTGEFTTWDIAGSDGLPASPGSIGIDRDGNVYVAVENTMSNLDWTIQKFASDGTFLTKWGSKGNGNVQFQLPSSIASDSAGNVYVVDDENHRVQKFDGEGNFLKKWGSKGTANGKFNEPSGIAVDVSDNIYVADSQNRRIQKFTSEGAYITKWGCCGPPEQQFPRFPHYIVLDREGNVYVDDGIAIYKFAPVG